MKKLFLLQLILFLQLMPVKAQYVTIPDSILASHLTGNIPNCMNGNQLDTTCSDIYLVTTVVLHNQGIYDLTGIKYLYSVTLLNITNNNLTTIQELPPFLKILSCGGNQISGISNLVLPNTLLTFGCSNNPIFTLPVLPNSLKYLDCWNNDLTSLPTLPPNLLILSCAYNQISTLPLLPDSLLELNCSNNLLTNLPQLPYSLSEFYCNNNQLTNIPQVPNVMEDFEVSNNNISCLINLPITLSTGNITNNPISCVPNSTNYSLGLPLCVDNDMINNPNNCMPAQFISGNIYTDINGNCNFDNTDFYTNNIPIRLYDTVNNLISQTYTVNGYYSFASLNLTTFNVVIDDLSTPIGMDCGQLNSQFVVLDSNNVTIDSVNFAVQCDSVFDIYTRNVVTFGSVFPGQEHKLFTRLGNNFSWFNLNCFQAPVSGTVTIEITGPVSFVAPYPNALAPSIFGNVYTYNIANFNSSPMPPLGLILETDSLAQTGDQICVHINILPDSLDGDTTNNTYDYCYQVVNSYDPNVKEVYPINVLPGYDDWFTYTIHFQNTGNAPAFNIRLRDTLDTNLDMNTFEMLGNSHAATTTINSNILTVRFNNIMLPDSTADYEGSMGFFQYRLRPLAALPAGTQIENTAYIYFDYNAPVVTNTTQNNFDFTVGKLEQKASKNEFILYPNPSNGIFNFKDTKNLKQVEVYNLLGEQILAKGNQKQINLSSFAKGIYYARINGEVVVKLVKE